MITATGLGSGLDIQGLVDSLVAAERAGPDQQLNRQAAKYQARFSALGSLKSALSSFQTALSGLTALGDFSGKKATSSNAAALQVSAGSNAAAASYSIDVTQLARAHSLASAAVATADETALGTGTLTFRFGTTDYDNNLDVYNGFTGNEAISPATIQIDSSNNTLEGIMAAVNEADIGVTASIVNDGTGYRLLFTGAATGLKNSLQISVSDNDGNSTDLTGLSQLAFDESATNLQQTVAAQDANLSINGLAVTSASNSVNGAIAGLSLTLREVTDGPVQVAVQADSAGVKTAINDFVNGYNQFIKVANALSAYDPETNRAAALVGDFTLRSVEGQVKSILRGAIPLAGDSFSTLAEIGITTTADGTLTINDTRLGEALAEQPERLMQLFASYGKPADPGISFIGSSNATAEGSYELVVTALATAGYFQGNPVLPDFGGGGNVVIDGDNDNLTLSVDGVQDSITLSQGMYSSGEALALEVQTRINNGSTISAAGLSITVSYDQPTNSLILTSSSEGSGSGVEIVSVDTNMPSSLGLTVGSGVEGNDVEATLDGVPVTGTGNIVLAGSDSDAEGLRLEISGDTTGSRGTVTFTRGIAARLDNLMEGLLDTEGSLNDRLDSLENRLDDIEERKARLELRWEAVRERYTAQFNALDTLLGQLQNTSNYLEQQLASLLPPNTGKDK
ncbi:MAG: flagellar filament capping protein FliD [Gammaproteobacteria bacterium]|nr:flagellar filament capping protein FliD [Pseudomonadales bacterium]MCP5349016.1 flagellar filament capping protein FliD [Pseudomonadales bacterium]